MNDSLKARATELVALIKQGAQISRERNLNLDYAKVADEAADEIDRLTAERDSALVNSLFWQTKVSELMDEQKALAAQEPVAWEYENESGVKFLTFNNPNNWHNHDKHGFKNFRALAAAGAAPVPEGWQLVPVEPTQQMVTAYIMAPSHNPIKQYKAMLAAAPKEQP